jgi:3-oxoacyl-[acyl-carrier-protein] synthase I
MNPVTILKAGMVTPVGLTAAATCAALRATVDAFKETRFMFDQAWLTGAQVPLTGEWRGRERMLRMAVPALQECISGLPKEALSKIPLLLCLPEPDRPGRLLGLDETLLSDLEGRLKVKFALQSTVIAEGRVAGVRAIEKASQLLAGGLSHCVVAGVDSLFVNATLAAYHSAGRLLTGSNSNGFIPGEAAAAVLVGQHSKSSGGHLACTGAGYGSEPASVLSDRPMRADGLRNAIASALNDASATWSDIDYRITDANGEQYWFKEAALAMTRTLRTRKDQMDLWHPADCIGEIGATVAPCALGVALYAHQKRYAPGSGVLCHFSGDGRERGALVLRGKTGSA